MFVSSAVLQCMVCCSEVDKWILEKWTNNCYQLQFRFIFNVFTSKRGVGRSWGCLVGGWLDISAVRLFMQKPTNKALSHSLIDWLIDWLTICVNFISPHVGVLDKYPQVCVKFLSLQVCVLDEASQVCVKSMSPHVGV